MPGATCCVIDCGACKGRNRGLTFHTIPKQHHNSTWRAEMLNLIRRAPPFNPDTAKICSRHFTPDCLTFRGTTQQIRVLKENSLPTLFMPTSSIITPKFPPRKAPTKRPSPVKVDRVAYLTFEQLLKDVPKIPKEWLVVESTANYISLGLMHDITLKLKVTIQKNFDADVQVYGFPIQPDITKNLEKVKLKFFLDEILKKKICTGIVNSEFQELADLPTKNTDNYFRHVVMTNFNVVSTVRSVKCLFLIASDELCPHCKKVKVLINRKYERRQKCAQTDIKPKTPLINISKQKLAVALRQSRANESKLKKDLHRVEQQLKKDSVTVDDKMHGILKDVNDKATISDPFLKLFWEQQSKAFNSRKGGIRWHPMMIRLAILIYSQSPQVYSTLRETGVLKLPGNSTLREYTNVIHPEPGFNPELLNEIKRNCSNLRDKQRWVVLLHDELTIKSDLVFDRKSGNLVGFIHRDNWKPSMELTNDNIATHALVFMVVGINTHVKATIGYFGTKNINSSDLYPIFWQAVAHIECTCMLKVIASTCDKASANQKFQRMHASNTETEVFKTVNLFAPDRHIYFISDICHLIKTIRNRLAKSGLGKSCCWLWNQDSYMLWEHVTRIQKFDIEHELCRTKLTSDHVNLTPHSVMNVRLAAQVLSNSVGSVMRDYGGEQCQETAKFILLVDRFFDCLNTRAPGEATKKRKPDLQPYTSPDDDRFKFLMEDFLGYLDCWHKSTLTREGNFSKSQRAMMFLSPQTYDGIKMTVKSFVECTKFLLANGVEYILSQKFCQDPLEEHFGRHRGLGRRCENPNLWTFGFQENKIKIQRNLAIAMKPRGNITLKRRKEIQIDESPLKKIRYK